MTDIAWIKERPVAHRGYHDLNKTRWENTLSAFAAAAEKNYAIECDVHLSRRRRAGRSSTTTTSSG